MDGDAQTTFEQMPRRYRDGEHHSRKPWALIIIVLVIALFGAYWYTQMQKEKSIDTPVVFPITETPPSPRTSAPSMDPSDLQAAVINTPIPDFSKDF